MRRLTPILLITLLTATGAEAQKTRVRVEFSLQDSTYVRLFQPAERERLEREAAGLIARQLADRLPVLDLVTTGDASYVLQVDLDRRGGSGANPLESDRGLVARLKGPAETRPPSWWGLFREADATGGGFDLGDGTVDPVRIFLRHIELAVQDADVNALVRDQLSGVPIAEEGRIWTPPPGQFGWVAPLLRQQLCLAEGTSLLIQVLVPSPFDQDPSPKVFQALVESDFDADHVFDGQIPADYQGFEHGVFTRPHPADQVGLDQLQQSDSARVQGVFLMHFQKDPQLCSRPPDPLAAEDMAGGGS